MGKKLIGAGILFICNGNVLLLKRKKGCGANLWGFPGGKVELSESTKAGACREVKEEVGITVNADDLKVYHVYSESSFNFITFLHNVPNMFSIPEHLLELEHSNYAWVSVIDVSKYDLMPSAVEAFKFYGILDDECC